MVVRAADYTLITGDLYKLGVDEVLPRCVFNYKRPWVMSEAYAGVAGMHYTGRGTVHKILQAGLWLPTMHMDTKSFCRRCDIFQRTRKPLRRDEMPLAP